ncbi:restriction endonuclease subunit S [Kiritimatiellaeota bacterium B1221]|nr:restriction endonuclease subunit S [Kiritimatiellaeota bacterium B1221]
MKNQWPIVALGNVLRHRKEFICLEDTDLYQRPKVKLHAKGIVKRDEVPGSMIKTKKQQVCRAGELLVAEIDAKMGGYGIVPDDLDGAIVSSHYFLYEINETKIVRSYLENFTKTPVFAQQVKAKGSTNYAAIRANNILEYVIPLPPIEEQRRIVKKIEGVEGNVARSGVLTECISDDFKALLISVSHRADLSSDAKAKAGWEYVTLGEVIHQVDDLHAVDPTKSYPNIGIYSYARGLFGKQPIDGISTSATKLRRIKSRQFIYSRLFAFEGAYGVVDEEYDGAFVSNEYPTFECDSNYVTPEFLKAYFQAPTVWMAIAEGSKGLGDRRQRVKPDQLLSHKVWIPPLKQQKLIANLWAEHAKLMKSNAFAAERIKSLMPAILDKAFKGEL